VNRDDAARLFANRICSLDYQVKCEPELHEFVDKQELPRSSKISDHKIAWTKFFMAWERKR